MTTSESQPLFQGIGALASETALSQFGTPYLPLAAGTTLENGQSRAETGIPVLTHTSGLQLRSGATWGR